MRGGRGWGGGWGNRALFIGGVWYGGPNIDAVFDVFITATSATLPIIVSALYWPMYVFVVAAVVVVFFFYFSFFLNGKREQ